MCRALVSFLSCIVLDATVINHVTSYIAAISEEGSVLAIMKCSARIVLHATLIIQAKIAMWVIQKDSL